MTTYKSILSRTPVWRSIATTRRVYSLIEKEIPATESAYIKDNEEMPGLSCIVFVDTGATGTEIMGYF